MVVKVFKDKASLGEFLAERVKELIEKKPDAVLGLATGSSPLATYAALARLYKQGLDFSKVTTFNLDEYVDCRIEKETYRYFMDENLFNKINVKKKRTHFPSPETVGEYDEDIEKAGGIDLQILGIGVNGHIAFNEPGTSFDSKTHITDLTESTREANKRFFNGDISLVPYQAVTMGLGTIMKARKIYLIANTEEKTKAIRSLLNEEASVKLPASVLISHPDVTILLTEEVNPVF